MSIAWSFCMVVLAYEKSRDLENNWILKLWLILAFMIASTRLQTSLIEWEEEIFEWTDIVHIIRMIIYAFLVIISVFYFSREDKFKEEQSLIFFFPNIIFNLHFFIFLFFYFFIFLFFYFFIFLFFIFYFLIENLIENKEEKVNYGTVKENENKKEKKSPEEEANIFSKITFWWGNDLLKKGYERALEEEDLWPLIKNDQSREISQDFIRIWNQLKIEQKATLPRALVKQFYLPFIFAAILEFLSDLLIFVGPMLLGLLIRFISNDWPTYFGYLSYHFFYFFFFFFYYF